MGSEAAGSRRGGQVASSLESLGTRGPGFRAWHAAPAAAQAVGRGGRPPQLTQAQEGVVEEQRTWQAPCRAGSTVQRLRCGALPMPLPRETTHHLRGTHSPWSYNDC